MNSQERGSGSGWQWLAAMQRGGPGYQAEGGRISRTRKQLGWGGCGGVERGAGEGSPTWCPVSPGMLACAETLPQDGGHGAGGGELSLRAKELCTQVTEDQSSEFSPF